MRPGDRCPGRYLMIAYPVGAPYHVQTKREITELLGAAGASPRKRLGQHFLIDGNLMRRLVASADLASTDWVLEVGGGTGGLTDLIAGRVHRLLCVEVDRLLYGILEERFRGVEGVTVIHGDVLAGKHRLIPEVGNLIEDSRAAAGEGNEQLRQSRSCVKLVANLPYQIATPLVMNLLLDYPRIRRLCFTVQSEVGERITADPNCKAYGPLAILGQALCAIKIVARVPPQAFWPRPSVESVMLRMDGRPEGGPFADREELRRFANLVRCTFDHRRKTLRSALGYVINEAQRASVETQFDTTRRPESFGIEEWSAIFRAVEGVAGSE